MNFEVSNELYMGGGLLLLSFLFLVGYALIRYPKYCSFRKMSMKWDESKQQREKSSICVPISIVVVCRDCSHEIEKNIPLLFEQEYEKFEIIIVDDASTDNTKDVINMLEHRYKNLRHTFLPSTTRYISRQKLALTLGIRSAKHEWVVITEPDCFPKSKLWLKSLSCCMTDENDIVLGYTSFKKSRSLHYKSVMFDRMVRQMRYFTAISSPLWLMGRKAVGGLSANMAIRKSVFIAKKGFSNNLDLLRGEDVLLVDEMAEKDRVAVACTNEASITQNLPTRQQWRTQLLVDYETNKHVSIRGKMLSFAWACSSVFYYIYVTGFMTFIAYALYQEQYIYAIIPSLLPIVNFIIRAVIIKSSAKVFDEKIGFVLPYYYELLKPYLSIRDCINCSRSKSELYRKQ